jgi:periplasmic divalent cation tolerance protein
VKKLEEFIVVLVTAANKAEAEKIAQTLLAERLIACANILGPTTSFFQWEGKVNRAEEFLMFIKSRKDLFEKIVERVKVLHSYEVPEVLAVPILAGSGTYLDWMDSVLLKK